MVAPRIPALCVCLSLGIAGARRAPDGKFEQNCAAKKQCNKPLEERDPKLHAAFQDAPKGHLKPLGHADFDDSWAGSIDVVDEMDPQTFWTKYWPNKPFILQGAAKQSPAFEKWKSDSYLSEHFGSFKMKCENKNEDRLTDYCDQERFGKFIKCGPDTLPYVETHMKLDKFLPKFRKVEFDKYVITQMPDKMADDFLPPTFFNCGRRHPADRAAGKEWMTQTYENNFWISYNGGNNFSSSVIHYDMNHQVMCLFEGKKEWIMWDLTTESKHIPLWSNLYEQKTHSAQGSDDSPIDGERVDLEQFPQFAKARWTNVTMNAGDCLYTPALHLHYVRSWDRNVAGMSMFQREERYDPECGGASPPKEPVPLSDYDTLWSFPEEDRSLLGWNIVKMGFPNWKRIYLFRLARLAEEGKLTLKKFAEILQDGRRLTKEDKKRIKAVFKGLDADNDGNINAHEQEALFQSRDLRYLAKDAAVGMEGGRGDQEEDVEREHYNLVGDTRSGKNVDEL